MHSQSELKMANNLKHLSKLLAVILRHKPDDFGIELDEYGFAPLDVVWQAIKTKYGERYTLTDLETVVAGDQNGKKRYEIADGHIRALYGHSTLQITYLPTVPPDLLYHGTNANALQLIRDEGLKSMNRQYVHLTTNLDNAIIVAKRRTNDPIILTIRAKEAHDAGLVFHQAEAEHYLVKSLPPDFIDAPTH